MAGGKYLRKRPQGWVFRRAVPKDLQAKFGRGEIVRSLAAVPQSQAAYESRALGFACEELFMHARQNLTLTTDQLSRFANAFGSQKKDFWSQWTPSLGPHGGDAREDYEDHRDIATLCMEAACEGRQIINSESVLELAHRADIPRDLAEANLPLLEQAAARGTASYCLKLADDFERLTRRRAGLLSRMFGHGDIVAEERFRAIRRQFAALGPLVAPGTTSDSQAEGDAKDTFVPAEGAGPSRKVSEPTRNQPAPAVNVVNKEPGSDLLQEADQSTPSENVGIDSTSVVSDSAEAVPHSNETSTRPHVEPLLDSTDSLTSGPVSSKSPPNNPATVTLSTHWDAFVEDKISSGDWSKSRRPELISTYRLALRLMGDITLKELTPDRASAFRARFFKLPIDHKNMWIDEKAKRERTYDELMDHVGLLETRQSIARVGKKTWNKHCGVLKAYLDWLCANRACAKGMPNIFAPLMKKVKKGLAAIRLEREMTSTISLRALLSTSIWRGRSSDYFLVKPGNVIIRDSLYWVPLLEICLGLRREEACQLRIKDFTLKFGYLGINLFAADLRVKFDESSSRRWVPLSKALLDLGIVESLIAGRDPEALIFPELRNDNAHGAYGVKFGTRLANYVKEVDVDFTAAATELCANLKMGEAEKKTLIEKEKLRLLAEFRQHTKSHGFRHWFKTIAENAGCKTSFIEEIMGHNSDRVSEGSRYMKEVFVTNLKKTIDMIPMPFDPYELRRLAEASELSRRRAA